MKQMSKSTLFKLPLTQPVPLDDIVRYGLENTNTLVIQILTFECHIRETKNLHLFVFQIHTCLMSNYML